MNVKLINILFTLFPNPPSLPASAGLPSNPSNSLRSLPLRVLPFALDTSGSFGPCRAASGKRGSFGPCRVVLDS